MARRFGPTQGAGVVVIETEPDKSITPAPTGITCYIGRTEKGIPNTLISCPTKADFLRNIGSYIDYSELPDSAFDFYNLGNGSGELYVVRVTDGTEQAASLKVYGRDNGHGSYIGSIESNTYDAARKLMFTISAKNGGRWAGRERSLGFDFNQVNDLTETTVNTGITMGVNEFAGANLYIEISADKVYKVVSNTAAGVLTVESTSTMKSDSGSPSVSADKQAYVYMDSEELSYPLSISGTRKGLSVEFFDGQINEDDYFGMRVYEDETLVLEYSNLSMDSSNQYYISNVVNDDPSNPYITVSVDYSGTLSSYSRPANHYGLAEDWSSNVLTSQYWSVSGRSFTNSHAAWVDGFSEAAGAAIQPQRIKCTYATSGTKFTLQGMAGYSHMIDTVEVTASTVGGSKQFSYTAKDKFTPSFTIIEGNAGLTDGDILYIDIHPFPVSHAGNGLLAGQYLYFDVDSDKRARIKIEDNTYDTITLTNAPSVSPDESQKATGTIDGTTTITFPLGTNADAIVVEHSGFGVFKYTLQSEADIATLVTNINTAWGTFTSGSGVIASNDGDTLKLALDSTDTHKGKNSFIRLVSSHSSLSMPTAGGILKGAVGDRYRLQGRTELHGGYDGSTPTQADYTASSNTTSSVINALFGQNKGLVKLALPGISADSNQVNIQKSFLAYAEARNYQYRVEIPSSFLTENAAISYINETIGRNDFGVTSFPSHAYVSNPKGDGLVLRSLTGSIHGREALVARNFSGYHKAAAGISVTLPNVSKLTTDGKVLNEEILNPQGINVIKKARGNFIIWGDRTISLDSGWKWKHQRELMSYYENILREEFDFVIFAINDIITQQSLVVTLQAFFIPEWQKRALRGNKFTDAVSIKIDDENNTALTRANGDLNAEIKLRLADTVERFIIRIGKAGIFEDIG